MDASARIANCLICTLAATMRDCPRCAFKAGLAVKAAMNQEQRAKQNTVLSFEISKQDKQEELKPCNITSFLIDANA